MTDGQWAIFVEEVESSFTGELDESREAALRTHFGRVPFVYARECLHRLVREGHTFLPTPAELVTALRRVAGSSWTFECLLAGETTEQRRERLTEAHYGRAPAEIEA